MQHGSGSPEGVIDVRSVLTSIEAAHETADSVVVDEGGYAGLPYLAGFAGQYPGLYAMLVQHLLDEGPDEGSVVLIWVTPDGFGGVAIDKRLERKIKGSGESLPSLLDSLNDGLLGGKGRVSRPQKAKKKQYSGKPKN